MSETRVQAVLAEGTPDLSIVTLNPERVHSEFADTGLLGRERYIDIACTNEADSDVIWRATISYQEAYQYTEHRLQDFANARTTHRVQELGTKDGTEFRLVATGLKPASLLQRTYLRAEARPDGWLPDVGFVARFNEELHTEPEMPGYFFNLYGVSKVLEQHRDIFDRLGYTSTDPRKVAEAVFNDRSPIGTNLLLGHSVEQALFGDIARLHDDVEATDYERNLFIKEINEVFVPGSPQVAIMEQLIRRPDRVETIDLLAMATNHQDYIPKNDLDRSYIPLPAREIWDATRLTHFLETQRLATFGPQDELWFKAL